MGRTLRLLYLYLLSVLFETSKHMLTKLELKTYSFICVVALLNWQWRECSIVLLSIFVSVTGDITWKLYKCKIVCRLIIDVIISLCLYCNLMNKYCFCIYLWNSAQKRVDISAKGNL